MNENSDSRFNGTRYQRPSHSEDRSREPASIEMAEEFQQLGSELNRAWDEIERGDYQVGVADQLEQQATQDTSSTEKPTFYNDREGFKAHIDKLNKVEAKMWAEEKKNKKNRLFAPRRQDDFGGLSEPDPHKSIEFHPRSEVAVEGSEEFDDDDLAFKDAIVDEAYVPQDMDPFETGALDLTLIHPLIEVLPDEDWKHLSEFAQTILDKMIEAYDPKDQSELKIRQTVVAMLLQKSNERANFLYVQFVQQVQRSLSKNLGSDYFKGIHDMNKSDEQFERFAELHLTCKALLLQELEV